MRWASHRTCRTSRSLTAWDNLTSTATTRPSPRSTIMSTSRSPEWVRRWATPASRPCAYTRSDRAANDSKSAPSRVPSRGTSGPVGALSIRPSAPMPNKRAARAGSARWWRGALARRDRWLRVGSQAGSSSRIHSCSRIRRLHRCFVRSRPRYEADSSSDPLNPAPAPASQPSLPSVPSEPIDASQAARSSVPASSSPDVQNVIRSASGASRIRSR